MLKWGLSSVQARVKSAKVQPTPYVYDPRVAESKDYGKVLNFNLRITRCDFRFSEWGAWWGERADIECDE